MVSLGYTEKLCLNNQKQNWYPLTHTDLATFNPQRHFVNSYMSPLIKPINQFQRLLTSLPSQEVLNQCPNDEH